MRTKATIVFAILAFMTTHAWALTATVNGITWTYTVSNGVASVGGGTPSTTAIPKGTAGDITIPATLGGKPVTSINYWAFYNCNSLSSVTIPDSITHIRQYAFYSSSISSMTIPDSVVCVEESAFASCASLQSVVIGNGVTSIGKNAFISCGLSSVVIPGNVSDIGVQAFKDCRQLNSVIIQHGVTSIGQSMFQGCTLLQSLSLPISLKSIGGNAFQGCLRLESVSIPNRLERIESGAFQSCSGLQSLSIPSSVKNIGSGAFQGCSGLVTVSIPNSNVNIESDVFKNCTSLASVTIPGTFRLSSLFPNNTITSVTIADGSTSILLGAFSENTTLKTVSIPNSVTSVGDYAFKNCSNISSITIPGEFNIGSIFPQSPITTVAIAEGSTRIVDSAFARREKITTIAIPNSVTNIGQHVFNSCSGLKSISVDPENPKYCSSTNGLLLSKDGKRLIAGVNGNVTIPDCVNVIGTEAFCGYSKLGSVNIPNGVTSIEKDAFYNCTSLSSMSIPNSVTLIGSGAFVGCSNITRVTVPGAFQVSTLFPTTYQSMTSVSIAEGSTIIADGAFSGCGNLSYISIPDGIVSIGNDAFSDCSKMTSIGIPEGVTNIGSCAFANCGRVKYITIPDSVMVLGTSAFWGCSGLKSLTIPRRFDSLNIENTPGLPSDCSIGYYAFFTVVSEHGEPNPEVGEKKRYVDSVSCSVASPVSEGSNQRIRFICPGGRWYSRGMTNAFSGTQVTIPLNDNTVLTWLWKTQYQISITTAGEGTCSFGTQWIDDGTSVTARIVPTVEHIHIFLSGDADNVAINGTTLTIPANKPRNISVTVTKKIGLEVAGVTTVYDGTPKSVSAEASFPGGATAVLRYALSEDGPYSETNPSFTDAGTNTVWVVASAAGEEPITNSAQVVILPKPIEAEMFESVQEQVFDGTAKTPSIVPTADWSTVLTTEDYAAQYENNIEVGVASIIVTGVRNCSGQITIPFTISEPEDTVWHVDAEHGSDENTGRSWVDALRTIQRAADRAVAGNTVLVTNGVYEPFAAMNKDIVIRSIEGADKTIVDGGGTNRCAALGESTNDVVKTTLVGFTLRNGSATEAEANGGGASGGVLEDCVIRENSCWPERSSATGVFGRGGGLCGSIANRCEIVGNHSGNDGGGAYLCILADCLVSGNSAANKGGYDAGGGMMYCRASRCTIVRNTVGEGTAFTETGGAGANSCVLDSCIVYENAYSTGEEGNAVACTATYSCFGSVVAGTGNIAADPKFVDAANGDFRLAADSPCIDAGNDASVRSATDLAGNERIFGRHVDMGAYENRDFFELAVEGVEVVYNGQPHNVAATATCPGATAVLRYALAEDGPYSETNPSFTDTGTNTVWVVASAEGADPITNNAQVIILPKALDASMFESVQDQVFDGAAKTPLIVPTANWCGILDVEDYAAQYENNIEVGVASIIVTGARNCSGQITIPFTILESADTVWFVDAENGSDENSGRSWADALRTIQSAVGRAVAGNTVLVTNGVYESFTTDGLGITIRSVEGPENTIVDGGGVSRCAFLGFNTNDVEMTTLVGFTLRNGRNMHGTGAFGGVVENCVITGNYAGKDNDPSFEGCGGGLFKSIARNCVISNNMAQAHGGGVDLCEVSHCIIVDNQARGNGAGARRSSVSDSLIARNVSLNDRGSASGGGARNCRLIRCTVAGNLAGPGGSSSPGQGGIDSCQSVENCIIYGNKLTDGTDSNANGSTITYSCLGSSVSGTGNIVADPLFVDSANGNYRLEADSPCIDAGAAGDLDLPFDLDGNPRVKGRAIDMGCYEFQTVQTETTTTPVPVPFAWLDKYPETLAANGGDYEAFGNATAANGADKVWQCYVSGVNPTNATERFLAQIAVTNGTSVVSWTPDLNEGGTKSERVYTVEGKTNLVDQSWGPTNEATRFFRVKVGIP